MSPAIAPCVSCVQGTVRCPFLASFLDAFTHIEFLLRSRFAFSLARSLPSRRRRRSFHAMATARRCRLPFLTFLLRPDLTHLHYIGSLHLQPLLIFFYFTTNTPWPTRKESKVTDTPRAAARVETMRETRVKSRRLCSPSLAGARRVLVQMSQHGFCQKKNVSMCLTACEIKRFADQHHRGGRRSRRRQCQ